VRCESKKERHLRGPVGSRKCNSAVRRVDGNPGVRPWSQGKLDGSRRSEQVPNSDQRKVKGEGSLLQVNTSSALVMARTDTCESLCSDRSNCERKVTFFDTRCSAGHGHEESVSSQVTEDWIQESAREGSLPQVKQFCPGYGT
jgi:hypothetical protein